MAIYLDDFYMLMTEIWIFCKIDIFSETISYGRTHFAIWGIKHYLILLVKLIQDHGGGSIFKHDGILGRFFQDLCGILIESHWNY